MMIDGPLRLVLLVCPFLVVLYEGFQVSTAYRSLSLMHELLPSPNATTLVDNNDQTSSLSRESVPKKYLPDFKETGGVVLFLHVAKTGGTTIRDEFAKFPNVIVHRVLDEEAMAKNRRKIEWHLSASNTIGETLILELHGEQQGETMTVFQMHPYIQRWKTMAKRNDRNFFSFTLIREPESWYVSYFNFFKHPNCKWAWCDRPLLEPTEENLLSSLVPNHQCRYLTRLRHQKLANNVVPVSQAECEAAYHLMKVDLDWVGTTERMKQDTLPLLAQLVSGQADLGTELKVQNKQKTHNKLKHVSDSGLEKIRAQSTSDRYLYDQVSKDYTLTMWENFPTSKTTESATADPASSS